MNSGIDERQASTVRFTTAEVDSVLGVAIIKLRESAVRTRPATVETIAVFGDIHIRN